MGSNFNPINAEFIEEYYKAYLTDPKSVDESWQSYFHSMEMATPDPEPVIQWDAPADLRIHNLINAYRQYGHLLARINPIEVMEVSEPKELALSTHGFSSDEWSKAFPTCGLMAREEATLEEIVTVLRQIYCDQIGIEYMGMQRPELEKWLQERIEPNRFRVELAIEQKKMILQHLNKSELLEVFIHTKYVGQKRFSLEGGETLIPMLESVIQRGADLGAEEVLLGMAHRGRLNVLSNILNKSYSDIFSEFEEGYIPESFEGSGDVKYHKGFTSTVEVSGKKMHIILTPNPSHLEAVNPVVEGMTRAHQSLEGSHSKEKHIPILVHGDAAIAGQGIIYETLQMYDLKGYSTGGTVHLVINNQIGFTTLPRDGRSTRYCTDIARAFGAPVFHVNAEDPEGCVYATNLAVELRQKFNCDVFIDLNCYRKFGHNESDEPAFTQPLEYQLIRQKKPIREIYRDDLIQQGVLEKIMAESLEEEFKKSLGEALELAKKPIAKKAQSATGLPTKEPIFDPVETGVSEDILNKAGEGICFVPEGFNLHRKLQRLLNDRMLMLQGEKPVDWGMAEMLAYATLLWHKVDVRISGQDCGRGTFSHRHGLWMDQKEEKAYFALQHLREEQGRFDLINSPLSEYAVLGFEYGYTLGNPKALVIWEAQFGDFANGGQVIIDQFITTSEQKWRQQSSLTLLLPHGYEGQGPEHSSARIERFLNLAGNENIQVVHPTTPVQLFHLLRRQVVRHLLKPLIVFTPKGLLRHPECVSQIDEFKSGGFKEILDDPTHPEKAKRLIFCSGRVYYDLIAERNDEETAIIRIEQLYPLHKEMLTEIIASYSGIQEYLWVQEEPRNMGAWTSIAMKIKELLPERAELKYVGRARSASPAAGSFALHKKQHDAIIQELFGKKDPSIFEIVGQQKG